MNNEKEESLAEVMRLLDECTNLKRLRGSDREPEKRAKDLARRAYEIAYDKQFGFPWTQLAAYRLAHLILRDEPSVDDLGEANRLLCVASFKPSGDRSGAVEEDPLGALPRIYRLAVLHRINDPALREETKEVYRKAVDLVKNPSQFQDHVVGRSSQPRVTGPIQHETFNLLELATYFLGSKYELQGFGDNGLQDAFDGLGLGPSAWFLASSVRKNIPDMIMPYKVAQQVLEDMAKEHPEAVLFEVGKNVARWCVASRREWRDFNQHSLLLLARALDDSRSWNTDELLNWLYAQDGRTRRANARNNLAQRKKTLLDGFKELTGRALTLPEIGCSREEGTGRFEPSVVLGVVEKASYLKPPTPDTRRRDQ